MNINRNNYEEYFLLYADNELSAPAKQIVEEFVRANTDLEEELTMLRQAVVKPDKNISLKDKNFLLKNVSEFINKDNYEAVFVLLIDNELTGSQVKETEDFIKKYNLQDEFALLQRAKLVAETSIFFPDKSLLYKKQKDERIIPLILWRAMAAAVLAGLGFWVGINYLQNNKVKPAVAVIKTKTEQPIKTITRSSVTGTKINTVIAQKDQIKNIQNQSPLKNIPLKTPASKIANNNAQLVKNINNNNKVVEKKTEKKFDERKNEDIAFEPTNTNEEPIKKVLNNPETLMAKSTAQDNTINNTPPNLYAQNASYRQENKNENYVFYNVTTEEFNRSKVGTFLKKLKRNIARRSPFNNNDQEVN